MTDPLTTDSPMTAPVRFLGIQPGFRGEAAIELYILLSPVGHHPIGSTVSRRTLERHGYNLIPEGEDGRTKGASGSPLL